MRNIFMLLCIATLCCSTLEATAEELYLVEPMICTGSLKKKPPQMHPSYTHIKMRFVSFKSTRRDGSLADSLEVGDHTAQSPDELVSDDDVIAGWYMGPLRQSNKKVYRKSITGRGDDLELTITDSETTDGKRTDTLKGTWTTTGSVVGGYAYNLVCKANVVTTPTRVDDFTN